ncbi:BCS1 N terminal-domain-containing protein [Lineolata rhizophorae]|uniref:BCS1 N terminal-domain-containing protein n=1 Tax=Lineolata rhizophorae TaxID=578093 RepID=A0A6A6P1R7_9PEZI|nr:BCS1 N terminal-domain-containing protein [Lineolata rhizophorae]
MSSDCNGPVAQAAQVAAPQLATATAGDHNKAGSGLFSQLTDNPFFTAGFGLAGLAAALRAGQQGLRRSTDLLRRRLLVDVEITRNDESYQWLLHWITAYQRAQAMGQHAIPGMPRQPAPSGTLSSLINKITPRMHHLQIQTARAKRPDGADETRLSLVPGQGRHILRYGNAFIALNRQRDKAFDMSTGTPFETITMTTLYAHRNVFEELFSDAHRLAQEMHEGKTIIYNSWGPDWKPFGQPKRKRPIDSVILERGVKERILEDIRAFLEARAWYLDRGIPYRRGYLLYGSPGTGKSSFILALAGELDFNIAILNLSEPGLTDDRLNVLLTKVPPRTIVLLEDADAAFNNRTQADEHGYRGATVTFSGLLNALDGVASVDERIIFLTTNHVQSLDPALVRPGRVDMTVHLGEATEWQIEQMWDRFYVDVDTDGLGKQRFMTRIKELGLANSISTASLQGLFLYNKDDMDGAVGMLGDLAKSHGQVDIR